VPNAVGEALRIVCVLPDCRAATNELVQGSKALCAEGSRAFLLVLSMLALMMYPVACFGITIIATWQHPKRMPKTTSAC
jgi:hypothetical protein